MGFVVNLQHGLLQINHSLRHGLGSRQYRDFQHLLGNYNMTRAATAFSHRQGAQSGIVLVNLGTPDAPTARATRRYLAEFLADPRVVELPAVLWLPLLHGLILRTRPARSAANYQKIWTDEGSPLLVHTQSLAAEVGQQLGQSVSVAMRYGNPSLASVLGQLHDRGLDRLIIVPLYPQYAGATTGTVFDKVTEIMSTWRFVPGLHMVEPWYDNPRYIAALAGSVRSHWREHGRGQRLLMSFHGVPRATLENGDPYFCHCHKTARLLAQDLDLADDQWQLAFQSRFGRARWLEPSVTDVLATWGEQDVGDIDVICPGFATDCLETLEEIAITDAEIYQDAGGGALRYIPCLNESDAHARLLVELITPLLAHTDTGRAHGTGQDTAALARSAAAEFDLPNPP